MNTKKLVMLWALAFWFILGVGTFADEGAGQTTPTKPFYPSPVCPLSR